MILSEQNLKIAPKLEGHCRIVKVYENSIVEIMDNNFIIQFKYDRRKPSEISV